MQKKIVISGATSGIGRALTAVLLKAGHAVLALGRDCEKLTAALDAQAIDSSNLSCCSCDFSEIKQLPETFTQLAQTHNDLDALVLCAGKGQFGSLEEFSYEAMNEMISVNFLAQAYLTKAFLVPMKRKGAGKLIVIGSESALQGARYGALYCASKFALRGFSQSLRYECAKHQINVTLVNPGMVRTPFFDALHFEPGPEPAHAIEIDDVVHVITDVLDMPSNTNIDEINLSPRQHVVQKKQP